DAGQHVEVARHLLVWRHLDQGDVTATTPAGDRRPHYPLEVRRRVREIAVNYCAHGASTREMPQNWHRSIMPASMSQPMATRPRRAPASRKVPVPANGSMMRSPGRVL